MSEYTLLYDKNAPKKSVNLRINSTLLIKARELNINLSSVFERQLTEHVRQIERARWVEENTEAIEAYNRRTEQEGVFSDKLRSF